jgi:hypothetical protein
MPIGAIFKYRLVRENGAKGPARRKSGTLEGKRRAGVEVKIGGGTAFAKIERVKNEETCMRRHHES